jgi:hypothetical protein
VFPAVETPAEERATIIDRASRSAEIDALTVRLRGKQEYWIPRRLIRQNFVPVRLHCIALLRLKKETLIASAALGAAMTGHLSLFYRGQTPVYVVGTERSSGLGSGQYALANDGAARMNDQIEQPSHAEHLPQPIGFEAQSSGALLCFSERMAGEARLVSRKLLTTERASNSTKNDGDTENG